MFFGKIKVLNMYSTDFILTQTTQIESEIERVSKEINDMKRLLAKTDFDIETKELDLIDLHCALKTYSGQLTINRLLEKEVSGETPDGRVLNALKEKYKK